MLPTVRDALSIIAIEILAGIALAIGGLILFGSFLLGVFAVLMGSSSVILVLGIVILIIGIYISFRFIFAVYTYLDQRTSILGALRTSWRMTRGHFWKIFITLLVAGVMCIVGILLLGIGILVAYPLASILVAKLYLAMSRQLDTTAPEGAVVEPDEVLPAQEPIPSE